MPFMVIRSNMFRFQQVPLPPLTTDPLRSCGGDGFDGDGFDGEEDDRLIELDSEETVEDRLMAGPVDRFKSCIFSYRCTLRPLPNSAMCAFHHRIMVYLARETPTEAATISRTRYVFGRDQRVEFIRPAASEADMDNIRFIHELNTRFKLWTVDTEFGIVKGAHAIVYILNIRDTQTGEIVVSTPADL
jgi:hypothetical protein